jgi:hypothetical protein
VEDRFRPDISGNTVAYAVGRLEIRPGIGPLAVFVIAEAKPRPTVIFDFDDEVRLAGCACQEIALRRPLFRRCGCQRSGKPRD